MYLYKAQGEHDKIHTNFDHDSLFIIPIDPIVRV